MRCGRHDQRAELFAVDTLVDKAHVAHDLEMLRLEQLLADQALQGTFSLWLFSMEHSLRRACLRLSRHPRFDQFILLCIFVSSAMLAVDEPRIEPALGIGHRRRLTSE